MSRQVTSRYLTKLSAHDSGVCKLRWWCAARQHTVKGEPRLRFGGSFWRVHPQVGQFGGIADEIDGLKRDKNVLMVELVRLRQQQAQSDHTVRQLQVLFPCLSRRYRAPICRRMVCGDENFPKRPFVGLV